MNYDPTKPIRLQLEELGAKFDTLDATVHAEAAKMASAVNNAGISSQIEFLIEQRGYSNEDIFNAARENLEDEE